MVGLVDASHDAANVRYTYSYSYSYGDDEYTYEYDYTYDDYTASDDEGSDDEHRDGQGAQAQTGGKDSDLDASTIQLLEAAASGKLTRCEKLIRKGADVNGRDLDDWTPLFWGAVEGFPDIVEVLLESGADATLVDRDGVSTLHVAA